MDGTAGNCPQILLRRQKNEPIFPDDRSHHTIRVKHFYSDRLLGLLIVVAFLVAVPASHLVWGKGHVPAHKEQVCHKGSVLAVGAAAVAGHEGHGDCFIDKNDPDNVFFTGDPCGCP